MKTYKGFINELVVSTIIATAATGVAIEQTGKAAYRYYKRKGKKRLKKMQDNITKMLPQRKQEEDKDK